MSGNKFKLSNGQYISYNHIEEYVEQSLKLENARERDKALLALFAERDHDGDTLFVQSFFKGTDLSKTLLDAATKFSCPDQKDTELEMMLYGNKVLDINPILYSLRKSENITTLLLDYLEKIESIHVRGMVVQKALTSTDEGWNALMISIYEKSLGLSERLLGLVKSIPVALYRNDTIQTMLTLRDKNGDNALTLAARHQPELVQELLNVISSINDTSIRAIVLTKIFPKPSDSRPNTDMTKILQDADTAKALHGLISKLYPGDKKKVYESWFTQLGGNRHWYQMLETLLKTAPVERLADIYAVMPTEYLTYICKVGGLKDEAHLKQALIYHPEIVASHVHEHPELLSKVLSTAKSITAYSINRDRALEAILYAKDESGQTLLSLQEIRNQIKSIQDEGIRYRTLVKILSNMPGISPEGSALRKELYRTMPIDEFYMTVKRSDISNAVCMAVAKERTQDLFRHYLTRNERTSGVMRLFSGFTQHGLKKRIARSLSENPSSQVSHQIRKVYSRSSIVHLADMCGVGHSASTAAAHAEPGIELSSLPQ